MQEGAGTAFDDCARPLTGLSAPLPKFGPNSAAENARLIGHLNLSCSAGLIHAIFPARRPPPAARRPQEFPRGKPQ